MHEQQEMVTNLHDVNWSCILNKYNKYYLHRLCKAPLSPISIYHRLASLRSIIFYLCKCKFHCHHFPRSNDSSKVFREMCSSYFAIDKHNLLSNLHLSFHNIFACRDFLPNKVNCLKFAIFSVYQDFSAHQTESDIVWWDS